ncbi:MAG: HAD-IIB family hydrolase [bacterium]|nr:HAD-IIB family hydrolase [bacterium]
MSAPTRLLVCDLDGTLVGNDAALAWLLDALTWDGAPMLAFATGRQHDSACALLERANVRAGAYLIAGVGSEIYERDGDAWRALPWPPASSTWDAERIRTSLADVPELHPQAVHSPHKISYVAHPRTLARVRDALEGSGITATLVHSHDELLDILPPGVDKGSAVRHLAERLGLRLDAVMTCGDTENDLAMLALPGPAVIVGNAHPRLRAAAVRMRNVYIARAEAAAGIREGLERFGWLTTLGWSALDGTPRSRRGTSSRSL